MNSPGRRGTVIPFHRKRRVDGTATAAEGAPPDRDVRDVRVSHDAQFSAQDSGGERESTPAIPPTGEVNPPSGPSTPFSQPRRQYSAQTVLYAATLAILIVWFGVIAAIAAWSNSK